MQPKKYDSFTPKRATNIDGFFAKQAVDRPRKPVFRTAPAPVKPQHGAVRLTDMPRRPTPQAVLASSRSVATPAVAAAPVLGGPFAPEGRKRGRPGRHERSRLPAGTARPEKSHTKKHPGLGKKIAKWSGLVMLVLALGVGAFLYKNVSKLTGNNNPLSLLSAFQTVHLKNQDGRVNILVAGNSADDAGHNGGTLTDSIMVLSVNTRDNTAFMVSIPRDLWVYIPGVGHSKINAAYPNGGMDTLQTVVETNLGITIDYQALVNYSAFKDLVQSVGGITITIKSTDPRGIYDPSLDYTSRNCCALAKYPNGPVTLNGKQALNLARARGDAYGSYGFTAADFDRTQHQRDMLLAIKDKTSSASVIANPLKVAGLVNAVGSNVKTDLRLSEIQTLYTYMKKVDNTKIASYNINSLNGTGTTMLANYTSADGQSALAPAAGVDDFSDIQAKLTKLLSNDGVTREGAQIVILNGTDTVGLAKAQEPKLIAKGITVLSEADAPAAQATTTIIDNSAGHMSETVAYLKKQYKATVTTNAALSAAYPTADLILIVGKTAVPAATTTTQ